jgi:hypothetical protein
MRKCRPQDYIYDVECYPNFFSCAFKHPSTGKRWMFEISIWKNDGVNLYQFLITLNSINANLVGFNNFNYDSPMIHFVIHNLGRVNHQGLYDLSSAYFAQPYNAFNKFIVWPNEQIVKQIDLMKIHHFDRKNAMIGLKMIEFNMGSKNIRDLPIKPNTVLTRAEADDVLTYNHHDVDETEKLYFETVSKIEFRQTLSDKYERDFSNHNDTKIGKDYFTMELEKAGIQTKQNGSVIQSRRDYVVCSEIILPYINFEHPELNKIKNFFTQSTVNQKDEHGLLKLKGFFKEAELYSDIDEIKDTGVFCVIDDLPIYFGAGGIHASRKTEITRSSETHDLLDWDVTSFYPKLAIVNRFYPEHLTPVFCDIYSDVFNQRASFPKKTVENEMLKLALNGVYGDSNNRYSLFLDPKYTLSITINGQLLLCMLAEQLMKIPTLRMIQMNTDGLTFLCPKEYRVHAKAIWAWWESLTNLNLEEVEYEAMYIRDVNNYMAKTKDGSVKRIGCYAHETALDNPSTRELVFRKDWGKRIVAKAAEAALVNHADIRQYITSHADEMDFMLRTKVPRSSTLLLETKLFPTGVNQKTLQNISRYYVSKNGGSLIKVMPPTTDMITRWKQCDHYFHVDNGKHKAVTAGRKPPSGKYLLGVMPTPTPVDRRIAIESGLLVRDCSNISEFENDIDYEYYINEARKIVNPLLLGTQS